MLKAGVSLRRRVHRVIWTPAINIFDAARSGEDFVSNSGQAVPLTDEKHESFGQSDFRAMPYAVRLEAVRLGDQGVGGRIPALEPTGSMTSCQVASDFGDFIFGFQERTGVRLARLCIGTGTLRVHMYLWAGSAKGMVPLRVPVSRTTTGILAKRRSLDARSDVRMAGTA